MELDPGETLNKKIRNAQLEQVNFILGMTDLFLYLCSVFTTVYRFK